MSRRIWGAAAARTDRWGACAALLEYGADPDVTLATGASFRDFVAAAERNLSRDDHERRAEFDVMKKVLAGLRK